jgi:hypothetical protein
MLLYTRKRILEPEFLVDRCAEITRLPEKLLQGPLDLLLLCQSVPDAECEAVINMVRTASPFLPARTSALKYHVANPYQILSNQLSHDGSLAKSPYLLLAGVSRRR